MSIQTIISLMKMATYFKEEIMSLKSFTSTITYSVFDMGRECETKEEYIEWVKQSFQEEHNIDLENHEITNIEYEEVNDE